MLKILLDENLRSNALWQAIGTWRETMGHAYSLDILRVGDSSAPPLGTQDVELLEAAASLGRIIVSEDKTTLPSYLQALISRQPSPGLIILRTGRQFPKLSSCWSSSPMPATRWNSAINAAGFPNCSELSKPQTANRPSAFLWLKNHSAGGRVSSIVLPGSPTDPRFIPVSTNLNQIQTLLPVA
jgi:hypothetical protein